MAAHLRAVKREVTLTSSVPTMPPLPPEYHGDFDPKPARAHETAHGASLELDVDNERARSDPARGSVPKDVRERARLRHGRPRDPQLARGQKREAMRDRPAAGELGKPHAAQRARDRLEVEPQIAAQLGTRKGRHAHGDGLAVGPDAIGRVGADGVGAVTARDHVGDAVAALDQIVAGTGRQHVHPRPASTYRWSRLLGKKVEGPPTAERSPAMELAVVVQRQRLPSRRSDVPVFDKLGDLGLADDPRVAGEHAEERVAV